MIPDMEPGLGRRSREFSLVVTVVCRLLPVGTADSCQGLFVRWWWLWYLQLGAACQHLLECNAHALDDSQQDGTANGTIPRSLITSSYGQTTTGEEAGDDGIVWVLLLPDAFHGAVKRAEQATPNAEVSTEDRCSHLNSCDSTDPTLAVGAVAEAFDTMPYCATDCAHAECTAKVVQDDEGTGIACVIHGEDREEG